MENGADQETMRGLLPVGAPLEHAFGIDQDVRDVLDVAHLVGAAADFEERVVTGRAQVGRIEQQAMRKARAPSRGELPAFALDVVDDGRMWPRQQRRDDEADALARARRREAHDMFRAVMAEIMPFEAAEEDAMIADKPCGLNVPGIGPACRTEGRGGLAFARPKDGAEDGEHGAGDATAGRKSRGFGEDVRRIGTEPIPPEKERERLVDRIVLDEEPGNAKAWLTAEEEGRRLGGAPNAEQRDR